MWHYTAPDVGSAYCWAELHTGSIKHPESRWTSKSAHRVAGDLTARDWSFDAVMTDHGSEFAGQSKTTVEELGVEHRRIVAGRPQTNGCVERVQGTRTSKWTHPLI